MEEEEKNKTKVVKKNTSSGSKKKLNEINNDELFEQIMAKKKAKKEKAKDKSFSLINMSVSEIDKLSGDEILDSVSKKVTKRKTSTSDVRKVSNSKKKEVSDLSNDELLEQIMAKKKSKKTTVSKKTSKPVSKEKASVEDQIEKDLVSIEEQEPKSKFYDQAKEKSYKDVTLPKIKETVKPKEEKKEQKEDVDYLSPESSLYKNKTDEKIGNRLETHKARKVAAFVVFLLIVGIVVLVVGAIKFGYLKFYLPDDEPKVLDEIEVKEIEVVDKEALYNECLVRDLNDNDSNAYIKSVESELSSYLDKYKTSVLYYDLTYGYKYTYNENGSYYAASTIKILDALYLYTKASEGEIDLDDTLTYTSKYARAGSKEMKKYKYGDKVSLRNLVKYEMTVSDNTSHHMLFDYIGYNKLNDFGESLGATRTLSPGEYYGNTNLSNEFAYVKYLYDFSLKNPELGNELMSYMFDSEQNNISLDEYDIKAASKYGEYGSYYHNIGIVNAEHPYILIVLTQEGRKDFQSIVHDISLHTYKLNVSFYQNRKDVCQVEVYGD